MPTSAEIAAIQECVSNPLELKPTTPNRITGVIGEAPSRYSKSPAMWNAGFADCGIDAIYLPFDIEKAGLKRFTDVLRSTESFMGINVTVPHKLAIMDYLDDLDPAAARIGAVNTVVRGPDGKLWGYNTDGGGFVDSILKPQAGQKDGLIASLDGAKVLLLGAGGAARAVAFHVGELLNSGKLFVCNRTLEAALALVENIRNAGYQAQAIGEDELPRWAPRVSLIINSTTKGQGGGFSLERYSALAPAEPGTPREPGSDTRAAVDAGVRRNHEASLRLASAIPQAVRFYDLIYNPEETVFLRHGRETGHRTMNGKAMIVCQAAIAFCEYICKADLIAKQLHGPEALARVTRVMFEAW